MRGEVREMEREWSNIKPTYRPIKLKIKVYSRSDVQLQPERLHAQFTVCCSEPTVPVLDAIYPQKGHISV